MATATSPIVFEVPKELAALYAPSIFDFPALREEGHSSGSFSIEIPNSTYHSDRSGVSCSQLKKLLRSPAHFNTSLSAPHIESSGPQNIGTALHTAVLEPHLFDSSTAVWEGGTRKGTKWDAFADSMKGKIIFKPDEMAQVKGMRDAINNYEMPDETGSTLGQLIAMGESEKTIYWKDEETGILCKIRPDNLFSPFVTFDLKTCGDSRPDGFLKTQALKLEYDLQAAMYYTGVKAFTGKDLPFCFIAVETDFPHGVWLHETGPGSRFFENGMRKFRYALRTLKKCRDSGVWPAYQHSYTKLDDIPLYATFVSPDGDD